VRLDALHVLLDDAGRWRHDSASVELARELDRLPDAPFADRLVALGILRDQNDPDFAASLTRLEAESTQSADKAVNLLAWMNSHGLSLLAVDWSKQLPPEMLGSIPLRFALADAYVRLRGLGGAQGNLKRGSLGPGRTDPACPLQAKAAHESGDAVGFETNGWPRSAQPGRSAEP
jgi:hypothetical protein